MKKSVLFLIVCIFLCISAKAQVTIGSLDTPEKGAVLELKSDTLGFLPPRVELTDLASPDPLPAHVEGMVVFNINTKTGLEKGLYYNTGNKWVHLVTESFSKGNWFYMPSTVIDTPATGTSVTKDLYQAYMDQFSSTPTAGTRSALDAPDLLTVVPQNTDFYYYIIGYDDTVFENVKVSPEGVLTYDMKGEATDSTYMNIVFVEK